MVNVFVWAKSLQKGRLSKPSKQIQDQLFSGITSALKEQTPSFSDCVNALMKFDRVVLKPFYRRVYSGFSAEERREWDRALIDWAEKKKPSTNATIRIVLVIQIKLEYISDINEVVPELKWLSLHGDVRSDDEFNKLRDESEASNLRKLLSLDMSSWASGQVQINKMYSILFFETTDDETRKQYSKFLSRHGNSIVEASASVNTMPEKAEEQCEAVDSVEQAKECNQIADEKPTEDKTSDDNECYNVHEKHKPELLHNGVALAEALLSWAREQKERGIAQDKRIADMAYNAQRVNRQICDLRENIASLESDLREAKKTRNSLEKQLSSVNEHVKTLKEEKAAAEDRLGRVQHMSKNSIKQELDGFRNTLASELRKTAKDYASDISDFSDIEKAESYKALLDEVFYTLKHNGIAIEEG